MLLRFYADVEPEYAQRPKVQKIIRSFQRKAAKTGADWREWMYTDMAKKRGIDPREYVAAQYRTGWAWRVHTRKMNLKWACYGMRTINATLGASRERLWPSAAPAVVDYLSVDTEGHEFEALRGFPFDRVRIRVVTVEQNKAKKEVDKLLHAAGMRLCGTIVTDQVLTRGKRSGRRKAHQTLSGKGSA